MQQIAAVAVKRAKEPGAREAPPESMAMQCDESPRDVKQCPNISKEFVRQLVESDAKVLFSQNNPKLKGSKSWALYEDYKSATTLNEMRSLGGRAGDIYNDLGKGYIRPVDPVLLAELESQLDDGTPGIDVGAAPGRTQSTQVAHTTGRFDQEDEFQQAKGIPAEEFRP